MYDLVSQATFLQLALGISLALVALNAVWSAIAVVTERVFQGAYRIWQVELAEGQIRWELLANLRFDVVVGVFTAALVSTGLVRLADPATSSAANGWITFGVSWLAFEVYYWAMHRAFHTKPLYRFHRWHHDSRVTTAFSGNSTSTVEALGWAVGFGLGPVLLSLVMPVSLTGWALYFLYNYSGNIVGHVNADFLPGFLGKRSQSWMMHPITYHSLHHARFVGHYGFGSTFMDRLFRTEWDDWSALHARVRAGRPMTKLSERA